MILFLLLLRQFLFAELHFFDLRQLVQRFQTERAQEIRCRAIQNGPSGHIQPAALLDEVLIDSAPTE